MSLLPNFHILNNDKEVENYSAGQIIFSEGQTGEDMYYIKSGEVTIKLDGKDLITLGAGEIFGEMALIDSKIRYANAIAKTDCAVVAINEKYFNFLVQEHPYFALNVMRVLADRLRKQTQS
ncbi:MAG: Crp/Fnr family transcriptional regulator [Methylovulum sp.]|uniref:Crp/Fnr family transcriptional regulator n=1 Tax=Methylovulum sp. TaxID=1916980 RepID=UPI00260B103D|nr:Crp/Fnr family transcriptional regulator [Methylovulum sp.]MDD2725535.1 Crp/Fnr family transcriptional regulator [Methylovulum sp.]MDD5125809.1 Crp/Fnr family transcriptional regulator [Methylovulum sp.]